MRSAGTSIQNSFVQGLITEASGLNFPENACTETYDCVFNINGTVETRPGFDFEPNFGLKTINRAGSVVVSYLWKNVAGDGDKTFLVVQVGSTLYFWDASSTEPVSNFPLSTTINLTTFSPPGAPSPALDECQFASGNGYLFVTHPYLEAFYISYNLDTSVFTTNIIDVRIRDTVGVDDGLDITDRPNTPLSGLSTTHRYNLYNQGWNDTNLTTWDTNRTDMPSNADVMFVYKNASEDFDTTLVDKVYRGNSPAPKGHFILSLYNQDRQTASGVVVPLVSTGYNRCSTVAFFQGRVFYSGLNSVGYNSKIFFSQIIEREEQFGHCYQANDPTSDTVFDELPNDGGWVQIQEAGSIIKMFTTPGGLLIFAVNGVWLISGSTGLGFTATDYNISRISSISALTSNSFVDAGGTPVWWNLDGIYSLVGTPAGGMQVQSLTMQTIQSFYNKIPASSKRHAHGSYNPVTGIIQWCYNSTDGATIEELYAPDRILNYNSRTNTFYPWTTSNAEIAVHAVEVLEQLGGPVSLATVVDDAGDTVVDDAGDDVICYEITDGIVTPRVKYLVSFPSGGSYVFTVAETRDVTNYVDWSSHNPVSYTAYLVSGYKTHGDGLRKFQPEYIRIFTKNDIPSAYQLQTRWDFANTDTTGRWSNPQQVNHNGTNSDYATRKLKIRGHGFTLQFKITQVAGLPFKLAGWSSFETVNANV